MKKNTIKNEKQIFFFLFVSTIVGFVPKRGGFGDERRRELANKSFKTGAGFGFELVDEATCVLRNKLSISDPTTQIKG